ncbi:MAG: phosphatase PAP2 family protein [Pseudomonadota bacterium]
MIELVRGAPGVCLVAILVAHPALAGENPAGRTTTGNIGDALEIVMPLISLSAAVAQEDWEGAQEFGVGLASTIATTYVLKQSINKTRPDGRDRDSFPSSHTAVVMHASTFIHERYGWRWAVPMYVATAFVGHSRIHDERHDEQDVLAGAVIGYVAARYFTTTYKGVRVQAAVDTDFIGVTFSLR